MIIIYDGLNVICRLNGEIEDFKQDPVAWFPDWLPSLTASNIEFEYPKIVDGITVGMDDMEAKIAGLKPLNDGEVLNNGIITEVPKPEDRPTHKIHWESPVWVETPNYEEYLQTLKSKIVKLTAEINALHQAGFGDTALQTELDETIKLHNDVAHEYTTSIQ